MVTQMNIVAPVVLSDRETIVAIRRIVTGPGSASAKIDKVARLLDRKIMEEGK